jgi:hypothetical protein
LNKKITTLLIFVLMLVLAVPAMAITFGEPDGDGHPFVGAIVLEFPDGGAFQACSGTLIAEGVFLTAAHCKLGVLGDPNFVPGSKIWITFDPTIDLVTGNNIEVTLEDWDTHPDFPWQFRGSDLADVAVILSEKFPTDIGYGELPTAGLLDQLNSQGILRDTRFTAVGYGTVRDTLKRGFDPIGENWDRNRVEQGLFSLTKAWLNLSMNPKTGSGGTCYGDSGGPHFIHLNGVETNIIASITVTGDTPCKATDKTYRMDTETARSFLGDYVDLP